MEIYNDVPKKFLPVFSRHEPVIQDHTGTIKFKECPRRYFYETVLAFKEKETPLHLTFGTCYHKFREVLEIEYMKDPKITRQMECLQIALKEATELWRGDPPPNTKWDFMTKARLVESCLHVFKHWQNEKRTGNIQVIATEQAINVTLIAESGESIIVGGRADQIVRWNGQLWGRDFKTTSKKLDYYDRRNDPNDQFARYTFMEGELNGDRIQGQLIEVLYNAKGGKTDRAKTPTGPIIKLFPVSFTPTQIERWKEEQHYWDMAMRYAREHDMYAMSYKGCEWCPYRSVCTSTSEKAMELKLQQSFVQRPWDHQSNLDIEVDA